MNRGGRREQVAEKKPVEEERGVVALYVDGCSIHIERIFKAGINSGGLLIRQIESGTQKPLSFSSFVRYSFSPFLTKYPLLGEGRCVRSEERFSKE